MSLKLFASGDFVNSLAKNNFVSSDLSNLIKMSDIAICNLEAPVTHSNMKQINKAGPHIDQKIESIEYLKNNGFNYVTLANNHIYDYGQKGLVSTIHELEKHEIGYVGGGPTFKSAYETKFIEKDGCKIALLSAAENEFGCLYEDQERGGYAWIFHNCIEDNIRKLKKQVSCIILFAHAGAENISMPIKEWKNRYKRLCDIGVDIVIGHHPHVPQGYENYNKSMIFYSLGNFYFDTAGYELKTDDSFSVLFDINTDGLVDFDIIYHKKINGQTCIVQKDEVNFCIKELNNMLVNDYEKKNNVLCIELFNNYYIDYYQYSIKGYSSKTPIISKIKGFILDIMKKEKVIINRNLYLLHNIRIDTHRFVVQRALSLISEIHHKK